MQFIRIVAFPSSSSIVTNFVVVVESCPHYVVVIIIVSVPVSVIVLIFNTPRSPPGYHVSRFAALQFDRPQQLQDGLERGREAVHKALGKRFIKQ